MDKVKETDQPLVSVIIRTCNRVTFLKKAIESVKRQTYPNIEIVVVEDGVNCSEELLCREYSDLNIKYFATGSKVGRTKVGNLGLEKAQGQYFNFLDDDDILFENHVASLVKSLQNSEYKVAYSIAEESQIVAKKESGEIKEKRKLVRYAQPFNRILLYHSNYIPIQSIMFERTLYEQLGGFDENLDVLEDWDLWVRYSTLTDFVFYNEITSLYHVPYIRKNKMKRDMNLHSAQEQLSEKFKQYNLQMNVGQVHQEMDYVIKKYKTGKLKRYIRLIIDFVMYGER